VDWEAAVIDLPLFITNSGTPPEPIADALTLAAARETIPRLLDLRHISRAVTPIGHYAHETSDELGRLLREAGSDKSTHHDYHRLYAHILGPRRQRPLTIFEVGLGSANPNVIGRMGDNARPGASLRGFRDFCPLADVYGADVDQEILFNEERIHTWYVDQTKPETYNALPELPPFDLVIDDGLHSPHAQLATVAWAIPRVAPGGWIVVEDIPERSLDIWHLTRALLSHEWRATVVSANWGHLFVAAKGL
jgi:methyltransferase family protein